MSDPVAMRMNSAPSQAGHRSVAATTVCSSPEACIAPDHVDVVRFRDFPG